MKVLMNGNQAVARGAYESGVKTASSYSGTLCTKIMESMSNYKEVYCEWATNEKLALEVAVGESLSGHRSFVLMETVGLNVAADELMFAVGSKINGGLVLVVVDGVGNDCKFFGQYSSIPILEPADSQDAKDFTKIAFELSEEYATPVILKISSGICGAKSFVEVNDDYTYCMAVNCEQERTTGTISELEEKCNDFEINWLELNSKEIGVITAGAAYSHVKEVYPQASILKLELVNPLPRKLIDEISSYVKTLYVVEDGWDVLERNIKNLGVNVSQNCYK